MAMPKDILRLKNLRFYAYHGLFPEEGVLGQHFEIDLDLYGDFSAASAHDDIALAFDYPRIYHLVKQAVTGRRVKLVETLAEQVARAVGEKFAPIELTIRVRKPNPPVAAHFDGIEVELHRAYS